MKTKRTLISSLIAMFFAILLGVVSVFAWFTYYQLRPMVEFQVGEISADVNLFGDALINGVELDDLMYVDFMKDIVNDETGSLNGVATAVFLHIEVDVDSLSVRNEINLVFPENQPDLLYLIIIEGVNVDPMLYTSDYHAYLTTFLPACDGLEQTCRDALLDHNAAMLALIESTVLDPEDVLTIQFVFWGDYNQLPDASNFLELDYLLSFSGSTFQYNKE
jgi:hypothetical protein